MTDELMTLREALNEIEAERDRLYEDRNSSIVAQVKYDSATIRWARAKNHYENRIRVELDK